MSEMLKHWYHEHPFSLVEAPRGGFCYGCQTYFRRGEKCYGCIRRCRHDFHLHEDCAEAPRNIRHSMHPQRIFTQRFKPRAAGGSCSICQSYVQGIFYRCTSAECAYVMHIRCAQGSDVMYAAAEDDEEQSSRIIIHHPSHPEHQLLFLRTSCSFKCDACGTTGSAKGSSYLCTTPSCQYWIHERCASLPHTIQREDHHHSLSLSFHVPRQYLRFEYRCEVCRKVLIPKDWIYHCELCSYALHLTCSFTKYIPITREKGIMEFPISDMAVGDDLIGAFLIRQGLDTRSLILDHQDVVDYKFHNHKLTLVSSSSLSSFHEEENSDDDDEEDYSSRKSELICDGCITPIFLKQPSSSSSSSCSSSNKDYYYMRCSMRSCKYYLHLACFRLPTQISSLPLLHQHENKNDHSLVLQSGDKLKPCESTYCSVCHIKTNGLFYACTKCKRFKVDIKCSSMPDTIYHAAHPNHLLNLHSQQDTFTGAFDACDGCNDLIYDFDYRYACGSCDFIVHFSCAMLPASTTSLKWDKHHPLLLTHDATLNHPGDFYCNQCEEEEMNPKSWMYHCRSCDISFHPKCFGTTSGYYRNIKFGQKYVIDGAHCHKLTYQILTTKRRCNVCGEDSHGKDGFYCASCIFFICFYRCGQKMIGDGIVKAVD